MIRDIFEVPDVEHIGDLEHFTSIIQDAGGERLLRLIGVAKKMMQLISYTDVRTRAIKSKFWTNLKMNNYGTQITCCQEV